MNKFRGIVLHATISEAPFENQVAYAKKGRPGTPGPLYNILIGQAGEVEVITYGTANHAGKGGWKGLISRILGTEGWGLLKYNKEVLGVSLAGIDTFPPKQIEALKWVLRNEVERFSIPIENICTHAQWAPKRKTDPKNIDVTELVQSIFTHPKRKGRPPYMICIIETKTNTVYLWNGTTMHSLGGHPLLYQLHTQAGVPSVTVEDISPIKAAFGLS